MKAFLLTTSNTERKNSFKQEFKFIRYFKCQKFGHIGINSKSDIACGHCTGIHKCKDCTMKHQLRQLQRSSHVRLNKLHSLSQTINNGIQCTRSRNTNLCQKTCCFPVCIDETSSYPRLTFVEWATIDRSLWINSSTLRIRMSYASTKRKRTWLVINSIITPWYQLSMETTAKVLPCLYIPAFLIYEYMISKIFILTAFELWLF